MIYTHESLLQTVHEAVKNMAEAVKVIRELREQNYNLTEENKFLRVRIDNLTKL